MRPRRFSKPSMYFALHCPSQIQSSAQVRRNNHSPFRGISFLLDLGKDTIRLIVDTVRALGHLAVALDLFLPAHIASLLSNPPISQCP
jgi:hypothetical protein